MRVRDLVACLLGVIANLGEGGTLATNELDEDADESRSDRASR
ncbi:hypothetical protein [Streptomyces syringium]